MKNIMAVSPKKYSREELERALRAQIDNSMRLGWDVDDIMIVADFDFKYEGVSSLRMKIPRFLRSNVKSFVMMELLESGEMTDDEAWLHDFDAWQLTPFGRMYFDDVGVVVYRPPGEKITYPRVHGASVFYRPSSIDLVRIIVDKIVLQKASKEEPIMSVVLGENKSRISILGCNFNLNKQHIRHDRYDNEKHLPIYVIHKFRKVAKRIGYSGEAEASAGIVSAIIERHGAIRTS
jgi:hypothetical protein